MYKFSKTDGANRSYLILFRETLISVVCIEMNLVCIYVVDISMRMVIRDCIAMEKHMRYDDDAQSLVLDTSMSFAGQKACMPCFQSIHCVGDINSYAPPQRRSRVSFDLKPYVS
jgi:hypothetical protein